MTVLVDHQDPSRVGQDVRIYLQRTGWAIQGRGDTGELWGREDDSSTQIAVPYRIPEGGVEWRSVTERLAHHERVAVTVVERALQRLWVDVTRLRAAKDIVIAGSIPLSAGTALVGSAYTLVRAAATTAQKLQGDIRGNFSKRGDEIASEARLGHTEEGSFIVPVLVPLTPHDESSASDSRLPAFIGERELYEPMERRVTRTLADALQALQQHVVEPARDVTRQALNPFVLAGGSREMVVALQRVLEQEAVGSLEASFTWAPAVPAPVTAPAQPVRIEAEAGELLGKAAKLLRQERYTAPQALSGPIIGIWHEVDAPTGEIVIQAVHRGRERDIRVLVRAETIDQATSWMREKQVILVQGRVRSLPGQKLTVQKPDQVLPLDETVLRVPTGND
jgi:hypothetical protein